VDVGIFGGGPVQRFVHKLPPECAELRLLCRLQFRINV